MSGMTVEFHAATAMYRDEGTRDLLATATYSQLTRTVRLIAMPSGQIIGTYPMTAARIILKSHLQERGYTRLRRL